MQLERHINKLPEIYARINKLEEFVTVVETNIDQLSRSIRDAQDTFDLTLPNRLEQLVLLTTKSSRPMFRIWTDPDYEPPEVFNAEDYLPNISIPLIDDEGSAESRPAAS
ncbi:hypothetical protein EV182_002938 [Spiromyces aspiralis]|uniref:Uncharacterized protein n=1 Tax=Spiromyces aspiralis TaxID=68401 RepID=A0ACC1HDQ3_9FUNG|nr:hypothetical protein EV182_002938 [Spiromyces aspiralis]